MGTLASINYNGYQQFYNDYVRVGITSGTSTTTIPWNGSIFNEPKPGYYESPYFSHTNTTIPWNGSIFNEPKPGYYEKSKTVTKLGLRQQLQVETDSWINS